MFKISIILPVFNVKDYLDNCLDSLKNQTIGFENLEVIFVDDCSTDNSYEIIKGYAKKYDNVKAYQTMKNSGCGGQPRNIGMEYATAPYIMFLDPDDSYYENACEILYSNIINSNADMISGNYMEYKNGEIVKPVDYKSVLGLKGNYLEINNIKEFPKVLELSPAVWFRIYRKEFLIENNLSFLEYTVAEDLYFVSQCLVNAKKIVYIDVPIVKYMIRESEDKSKSVTAIRNVKNLLGYIHVYNKVYNLISEYDEELAKRCSIHLYFGTIQLVLSQTLKTDKMDFLYNAKNLYKIFFENFPPLVGFEIISKLISEENFIATINVADLMNKDMNDDENLLTNINKKEIIILYDDFRDIDQMDNIYDLINSLSNENFYISVININSSNDINIIDNNVVFEKKAYSKKYGINNRVKFISAYDYIGSNTSEDTSETINSLIYDFYFKNENVFVINQYVIIKEYSVNEFKKYNFYKISDFNKQELNDLNQFKEDKVTLNKIISSKRIIKSELVNNNHVLVKSIFNEGFKEEYVYTSNNEEHFVFYDDKDINKIDLKLFSGKEYLKLKFDSKKEYINYFLSQYCFNLSEKPFLINKTSNSDVNEFIYSLTYEVKNFDNYTSDNWINILKKAYTDNKINEILLYNDFNKYKDSNVNYEKNIFEKKNELAENIDKINEKKVELKKLNNLFQEYSISRNHQNKLIREMEIKAGSLLNEKFNNEILINGQKEVINNNRVKIEKINEINNLKTSLEYNKLKGNFKKRLILFLPYLYIIYNHRNILVNIRLYRKIIKNNWLDIGFYLNENSDLSRKKWCKFLTPETHYVCHGFDEKRAPNQSYKNNFSKKDIIFKLDSKEL